MKWTTERPTVAGWYWTRLDTDDWGVTRPTMCQIAFWDDDDEILVVNPESLVDADRVTHWSGPIPEPDPWMGKNP